MELKQMLLVEFDREVARTRKMLERLPDEKCEYKPHEKSMSFVKLANHTADIPAHVTRILAYTDVDMAQPREPSVPPANGEERVKHFDALAAAARANLAAASDEALDERFTLRAGDRIIFSDPRYLVIRTLFFNHMIHHRAQLGMYLRLNDCPVPSIYGPSADEG
jgi:uncharacterized damage-inducible protein DinB